MASWDGMTQRYRVQLLLLALGFWAAAVVADRHHLGYVEFALTVAGIVAALLSLLPDRE